MATRTVDLGSVVGPQGPQGPAGPNEITSATETDLNGVLMGDGSNVGVKPVDAVPTPGSTNLVQSGGVASAVSAVQNTVSRRNLLDNWFFASPVNQRGSTSYTASGYTIDRWEFVLWNTTSPSVQLTSNGLKISGTASGSCSCQLTQKIDNPAWLSGKKVTISCQVVEKVAGNSLRLTLSTNVSGGGGSIVLNGTGLFTKTFTLPNGITSAQVWIGQNGSSAGSGNTDFTVSAIKLELGDTQTLAHQENGVWVLNDIPNYAEELAKCQRYAFVPQIPSGSQYLAPAFNLGASSSSTLNAFIYTPVVMRSTPTASGSLHSIRGNGVQINSSISIGTAQAPIGNTVVVPITTSSSFSALTMGYCVLFSSLILSADL